MTTALYRRYRPESFAELIGQTQVTDPLISALKADRVNHAYLFSGPRGCGKTTSARILARCLNCAEGPTDTPCGKCPSCIELARGGSGSLDVVEIDADARSINVRLSDKEIADRLKKLPKFEPKVKAGWLSRYAHFVQSADKGAVMGM